MQNNVIDSGLIKNIKDVDVASSEILTRASLNRNFKKLFDNDVRLISNTTTISNTLYRVLPWEEGKVYSKNELVWYVDFYLSPKNKEQYESEYKKLENVSENTKEAVDRLKKEYYTTTLYLLRSLKNGNSNIPQREIVDMVPLFDASGWKNENPLGSIYTDYFEEFTVANLKKQLYKMHESVSEFHKFGELSSYSEIKNKVLHTDMSNIDPTRSHVFFPNKSYELDETNTILDGSNVRYWDCGLVEYNIVFKLGDTVNSYSSYNSDGTVNYSQHVDANQLNLGVEGKTFNEYNQNDNRLYYLDESDANIFEIPNGYSISENGINQHNVNNYINSYTGTIRFPMPFIDTNYMIFLTDVESAILHGSENGTININKLVFVNKSRDAVTALLILPNYEDNSAAKVLHTNKFRCQIIGRWK